MKTTVEPLEGNKVKLSVELEGQEFEDALNKAFRKIAKDVRIPGFRPGKAPRKIIESHIGADVGRHQALNDSIPDFYIEAVREHEIDVIAPPDIDITGEGEDGGTVSFDAVVEIRPVVAVPGYASLRVTIPSPHPTDEEIDEQLERLRKQHAEFETVEREAADGDHVILDIEGSQDGEQLDTLTAEDYSYELGLGAIVEEFDENIRGAVAGATLEFDADHPAEDDAELHFKIVVKEVKEVVLPELTDEFAAEASEFETLDELRADLVRRASGIRKARAHMALREGAASALGELVDEELPDALISGEMQERLRDLTMRLQAQGMTVEQWMMGTGQTEDEVVGQLKEAAIEAAKVDLALRAVVEAESIEVTEEDLDEEFNTAAASMGMDVDRVRLDMERAGQLPAIRSDVSKRKALDWLVETVEIVDEDGQPVERAELDFETLEDEEQEVDELEVETLKDEDEQ